MGVVMFLQHPFARGRLLFDDRKERNMRDTRTEEQKQGEIAAAVAILRDVVTRFILSAENGDVTSTKKMLETSVEIEPAMQAVVRAKTGVKFP